MTRLVLILALVVGNLSIPVLPGKGVRFFPDKTIARIVISQDQQQMLIYEGTAVVRRLPVSTGWPGMRKTQTPTWIGKVGRYWGTFSSFGTTQDLGYWLYTDYLPDGSWNGDILVHGAPYTIDPQGQKVYDMEGLGTAPLSHGCIRLSPEDAEWFHQWDPVGVPLAIESFSSTPFYPRLVFGAQLAGDLTPPAQGAANTPESQQSQP
jgi:lipoprotein-anchoring transpeptidase ErfK/SrfK